MWLCYVGVFAGVCECVWVYVLHDFRANSVLVLVFGVRYDLWDVRINVYTYNFTKGMGCE